MKRVILTLLVLLLSVGNTTAGVLAWAKLPQQELQQSADNAYESGDYRKAYRQYFKMAAVGSKFAQYRLSLMLLEGKGTDANLIESYAWASVAAELGPDSLKEYAENLYSLLSESDQLLAKRRAEKKFERYNNLAIMKRLQTQIRQEAFKTIGRGVLPEGFVQDIQPCDTPIGQGDDLLGSGNTVGSCGAAAPPAVMVNSPETLDEYSIVPEGTDPEESN